MSGEGPRVFAAKQRSALRLAAVAPAALARGLTRGMTLADARARAPDLIALPHRPEADEALLELLVQAFGRFSPMVARDDPHGLMLDVTGCAHLFGGEEGLVRAARRLADRLGLQARTALARTPQTARALTRFGRGGIVPPGGDPAAAGRLPVAALELLPEATLALRRAGLATVGDVAARPRDALAARFGADFPDRLDLLLGRRDARITPLRPPPPVTADRVLVEPITGTEQVEGVLGDLLAEAAAQLERRGEGARGFILTPFRVDGQARRIAVGTARATRDVRAVARLFRERLAALETPLDPGFGFDHLRLEAEGLRPLPPEQAELMGRSSAREGLDSLIDRLTARLGPEAVLKVAPQGSHLPERACRQMPAATDPEEAADWPEPEPDAPPGRPLQILDPPQPIEAVSLAPDGPPARFRWRRVDHRIVRAEGPERIEGEWWRRPAHRMRDYYRVEAEDGRRFWLFRAGRFGEDPPPRWYVHGLFP